MVNVVVRTTQQKNDEDRFTVLEEVLKEAGFWDDLEALYIKSGKTKSDFLIAVKPNLMMFYSKEDMSVITEPALVEHLINKMAEKGYTNIALVESQNVYGNWFRNREVENVANHAGYEGKNYRIVDLTKDAVAHQYKGSLGMYLVGKTWRDADFRISFAKNKTHFSTYYTLTIKNIYGTTPEQNKFLEYHRDREVDEVTIEMLKEFPVHFGIIDGIWGSDGLLGIKADYSPKNTKTLIAGSNLIAVDMVGAIKMGLDPMKSGFTRLAVEAFGKPGICITGDGSVYKDWDNVPPGMDHILNYGEEWYGFSNLMGFLSSEMDDAFPVKFTSRVILAIRRFFLWILKGISVYE
ncbi:MAG: DUF362 domain-containing protein [Candidatus Methanoperedens sp.]|nr:DUF362 domain-containing protein [Candidatus Methanoperedens sp.]